MNETPTPKPGSFPDPEDRIQRDLGALGARSRRNPPSLSRTMNALSGRVPKGTWEERLMAWTGFLKMHPRFATLSVTAGVAAALLVVPISYNKVVGHEVAVSLNGSGMSRDLVDGLAAEFKAALHADAVNVVVDESDGGTVYTLSAASPEKHAPAVSRAFSQALTSRGIPAESHSDPIRRKVSGNVYAMAYDNTFGSAIQVEIDGKSAEEIEAEILAHLEAAGFDARVSVTLEGDDHMKIEVEAESEAPDGGAADDRARRIVLTRDGQPLSGTFAESTVRMTKAVDETGERLTVEVMDGDRTVSATVRDPRSLSDAELAETVRRQLADQGLEASVSAENGRVRVLTPETPAATPVEKTTWGRIKKELGDPD
jgi:hypothetical protein